jgi:hypothetical protein
MLLLLLLHACLLQSHSQRCWRRLTEVDNVTCRGLGHCSHAMPRACSTSMHRGAGWRHGAAMWHTCCSTISIIIWEKRLPHGPGGPLPLPLLLLGAALLLPLFLLLPATTLLLLLLF